MFGLAAYTAQVRTKEIGVRKVLGASISGIIQLLAKDFVKLVVIAIVIATPIAWYLMNAWLQDFAYKINMSWSVFVIAGSIAVDCIDYSKLSINKSSNGKPCKEFENGMIDMRNARNETCNIRTL